MPSDPLTPGQGQAPGRSQAALREDALAAWQAGLAAVEPETCTRRALAARGDLDLSDPSLLVVAAGKAAAGMLRGALSLAAPARAIAVLPASSDAAGLPGSLRIFRGGHPLPTRASVDAGESVLEACRALGRGERLLLLLSGGASALLEAPAPGFEIEDLVACHRALVASGLEIAEINLIRGCLSSLKAGRLAEAAAPAAVTTFAISDVEGDHAATIGSGPTVLPTATRAGLAARALEIADELRARGVELPARALATLREAAAGARAAAASASAPSDYTVIASVRHAAAAADAELLRRGYRLVSTGIGYLGGSTASAAPRVAALLDAGREADAQAGEGSRACVLGGETTVAITCEKPGCGGRNLDLAARLALAIAGRRGVAVVSAGTDGCDGSSRAAGAVVDGGTAGRAAAAGFELGRALAAFDTEPALEAAGDLLVTGPSGSNVGDLVVAVVDEGGADLPPRSC